MTRFEAYTEWMKEHPGVVLFNYDKFTGQANHLVFDNGKLIEFNNIDNSEREVAIEVYRTYFNTQEWDILRDSSIDVFEFAKLRLDLDVKLSQCTTEQEQREAQREKTVTFILNTQYTYEAELTTIEYNSILEQMHNKDIEFIEFKSKGDITHLIKRENIMHVMID